MTGSSTRTLLLLLLPLCISFYLTSTAPPCRQSHELLTDLSELNNSVKDCENCSSVHITDKCKCFNLTASIGKFPDYFTNGLKSLNQSIHSQRHKNIEKLIDRLELMGLVCQEINITSLFVKYEPVISPADLLQKLKDLAGQIKKP